MFEASQYQLLDFGAGRKLERFGSEVLDRPSPAAEGLPVADPDRWATATARFDLAGGGKGRWVSDSLGLDDSGRDGSEGAGAWPVRHGDSQLLMELRPSGNIGVFPEQADNWDWIADAVRRCSETDSARRPKVLNLFGYTGAASLAAAAAGAEVTHVDSSGPTVAWAKRNAEGSGLADRPIRWLVDDAMKFVAKECRRGNRYDGVIADPPTYGHGPKGRPFKFGQHVDELLDHCAQLLDAPDQAQRFLLFSCHAPGFGVADAESVVAEAMRDAPAGGSTSRALTLESSDGRRLSAGVCVRWSSAIPLGDPRLDYGT